MSAATRVWRNSCAVASAAGRRTAPVIEDPTPIEPDVPTPTVPLRHVSPHTAAALLGQPRALLTERQAHTVDVLKGQCAGFTTMRRLVLSFRTILRVGTVPTLH